jgi:hypothetical protein
MALLLKCGAVFLHIPKTGGTWVTRVLTDQGLVRRPFGDIHADMVRVLCPLPFMPAGRTPLRTAAKKILLLPYRRRIEQTDFRFCFVRHPLQWYESYWRYQVGGWGGHGAWKNWGDERDPTQGWHWLVPLNHVTDDDFNGFIRRAVARRPGYVTELYGWYTQGGIGFVGKQENLVTDLIRVLKVLNVNFDEDRIRRTPPANVSRRPKIPIAWDPELRREVERLEYAALVRYGYLPKAEDATRPELCTHGAGRAG